MFSALLKSRFQAMFSAMFRTSKNKKKRGIGFKVLIGFFAVYVIACMFFVFGMMFYSLTAFAEIGLSWLYFAVAWTVASALCFIGSVFMTQSQLFDATDNELLLSMPVPPSYILASRMVSLLLINYLYEALVVIPAIAVYVYKFGAMSAAQIICWIVACVLLPVLVLALSCLFGWLLAAIASRLRNKNIITAVASLLFLVAYLYIYSKAQYYLNMLLENGESIASAFKKAVFPAYHFGLACADGNILSLLIFAASCIIPFALVYAALSVSFIRICTANKGAKKIVYRKKALKTSDTRSALIKRELSHFWHSPMYMLNSAIGLVFMILGVVYLGIKRDILVQLSAQMPEISGLTGLILCAVIVLLTAMTCISAPSINMEGKSLWILRSLPVNSKEILEVKAYFHIAVCVPFVLVSAVASAVIFGLDPISSISVIVISLAATAFTAYFGVAANLLFPKFDWISEAACAKQSMSVVIAMFGSMAIAFIPGICGFFIAKSYGTVFVYLFAGLFYIALTILTRLFVVKKGVKMFEKL